MGNKVRYIGGWDTIALTLGKEYEVLSIEKGWYRIMSDLGEDYLFPPKLFEPESGSTQTGEKQVKQAAEKSVMQK